MAHAQRVGLLYDRAREHCSTWEEMVKLVNGKLLHERMERAQVIDATEVDHWFDHSHTVAQAAGVAALEKWGDVEYAPPPYRHTWIETDAEGEEDTPEFRALTKGHRRGMLVTALDAAEMVFPPQILAESDGWYIQQHCKWIYEVYMIGDGPMWDGEPILLGGFLCFVDQAGRLLPDHNKPLMMAKPADKVGTYGAYLTCTVYALMACHPSNVPRRITRPIRQASRLHQRQTGRPLVSYWTLDVGPTREDKQRAKDLIERAEREGRAPPRLHWVRGHFKRGSFVTEGRPYGRYCRPFLRGTLAEGAVVKRYDVSTPGV